MPVPQGGVEDDGAKELAAIWAEAFPASYRVDYEVEDALEDIARFEKYGAAAERAGETVEEQPGVHVYLPEGAGATLEEDARVKLYMLEPKSLSQILPYFHNLGLEVLDERPFEIETSDHRDFFLYDLGLKYPAGVDPIATGQLLADSFGAAVSGVVESDSFDRLVLREGMHWRQVVVLRAYAKYMRQMGNTNSYGFLADTLLANPDVNRGLSALFEARFDPVAWRGRAPAPAEGGPRRTGRGDRTGRDPRRRPRAAHLQEPDPGDAADQLLPEQAAPQLQAEPGRH